MAIVFPKEKIEETSHWIQEFREDWVSEVPLKMHAYGTDDGHGLGGPPFHPEFEHWLGQICFCGRKFNPATGEPGCPSLELQMTKRRTNTASRQRTTRAFRKLRKVAPREFDALYLMCALQASFWATLEALNLRAERLDKPERYEPADLMVLIVSGIDKVRHYYD
jgi:hypothetical protein